MSDNSYTKQDWHVAKWPPLAWIETGLKAIAIVIGIYMGFQAVVYGCFAFPEGLRLAQTIIMVILSLGLIAAIFDRIAYRDIISMIFVIFNNLGHWGIVLSLLLYWDTTYSIYDTDAYQMLLFCGLMLLGDIVKLIFIATTDFTVRDTPRAVLFGLTGFYVIGYIALLILETQIPRGIILF